MAAKAKMLILLGDGMGGRPVPELDGRTTIEATDTPAFDKIASEGACGLLNPISPGVAAGSDTAHMAILGYDPYQYYRGRGPFEAKGVGLEVNPGDVAFRCNFATIDNGRALENRTVIDRRAGRINKDTDQLRQALNQQIPEIDGVEILFKESVEHRCALVLRGEGLNEHVGDVDPHLEEPADYLECKSLAGYEDNAAAHRTADIVNQFVERSRQALNDHPVNQAREADGLKPANIILPRGVGTAVELEAFAKRYQLSGALMVEVDLVRGLGLYLDMDVIACEGASGGRDTDELAIAAAVVSTFEDHDFVLANIKAPDLGGHDGDVEQKMAAIEKVDRALGYILDNLDFGHTVVMLAADHCTPISVRDHSGDPVPAAFFGYGVTPDEVPSYGERACAQGDLGNFRGSDVMNLLRNYAGAGGKFGA